MIALLFQWIKANRVMLVNAGSLIGTTLVTGVLGFAYWLIADRQFRPDTVGLASASVSAMMLLGPLCVLGLGTLLIGELPRQPDKQASLISAALILVSVVGGIAGILFALIAPMVSSAFLPLRESVGSVLIFASGVSLASLTIVLDQALIGLLYGGLQFWRNTIFSALKLIMLYGLAVGLNRYAGGVSIYGTWALGNLISLIPLIGLVILKKKTTLKKVMPDWGLMRKLGLSAFQHHMLDMMRQVPITALPVMVTILLSATANALFYTAWMISGLVFIASFALTTVLYAISPSDTEELARKLKMTLGLSLLTAIGANLVLQLGAGIILSLFGQVYAQDASWCLRVMSLAAFPTIIKYHYVAVKRIDKQMTRAMLPVAIGSFLELTVAAAGARMGGLLGLTVGWVIAVYIQGFLMTPAVFKAAHFRIFGRTTSLAIEAQDTRRLASTLAANGAIEALDTRRLSSVLATNGAIEEMDTRTLASVSASNASIEKQDTRRMAGISNSNAVEKEDTRQLAGASAAHGGGVEDQDTRTLASVSASLGPIEDQDTRTLASVSGFYDDDDDEDAWRYASGEMVVAQQMLSVSFSVANERNAMAAKAERQLRAQRLAQLSGNGVAPDMLETRPVPSTSASNNGIVEDTVLLPRFFSRPPQRTCPRCQTRLDEHASFCKNCGARLDKSETSELAAVRLHRDENKAAQSLSQALPCPQCGKELPPHAKFCSVCGQHIEQGKEKWSVAALVTAVVTVVLPIVAFAIWAFSLEAVHINLRNMDNLGLISIFPPSLIVALLIIAASFGLAISQKRLSIPILLFHILILIFVLYGVTALVESIPRFAVVYRHAGYTDYIIRHGGVDPNLDAYFNWPGFFIFVAFMTKIMGYNSILPYAAWAPVFNNLLYLGPLYMLGRTFTNDKRIVWLSLFFFFVTNWIAQDYFSPQGFNFFLYLVMIVILVKWFKAPVPEKPRKLSRRWRILGPLLPLAQYFFSWLTAPDTLPNAPASRQQRVLLMASLIAIFGLMVFTHPLTPFLTIAPVTALVVLRRNNPIWLPVVMIVMTAAWLYFMAQPYLAGNISALVGDFTQVGSTVTQNVTGRVTQGDPQHNFISDVRLLMTVFVWVLALIGGLMRLRKGYRDVTYVILALAPFPVFLAQSYGGEMLLRIYLFTLPPMCLFAASIFFTSTNRFVSIFMKVAVIILCVFLMGTFLYTRYGNERMDYITTQEFTGVEKLYDMAPRDSYLLEAWGGTPWEFKNYEEYNQDSLEDDIPDAVADLNVNAIVQLIHNQSSPNVFIIITRTQRATGDSEGLPHGTLDKLEQKLLASKLFVLVYTNRDVQILHYVGKN